MALKLGLHREHDQTVIKVQVISLSLNQKMKQFFNE